MNNVFLPFTYKTAQILPCATESELSKKIKESDFLISDEKCAHRMVGVKYDRKTMSSPKITFTAMRHEMILAKQIAFNLGKKIFYDDSSSASLFKYTDGDCIDKKYFQQIAGFYNHFFHHQELLRTTTNKDLNQIDISEKGFYINGHLLKIPFKIQALTKILGKPDEKNWKRGDCTKSKAAQWYKWGLVVHTDCGQKDIVCYVFIFMDKDKYHPNLLPFSGKLTVYNKSVDLHDKCHALIHNRKERFPKKYRFTISKKHTEENTEVYTVSFSKRLTMLYKAVMKNNFEEVCSLIASGADVNERCDFDMSTPLFHSAITNQLKMAELLLANGADVNTVNMFGSTPLMECVESDGTKGMIQLLINAGADTAIKNKFGKTVFDIAKANGVSLTESSESQVKIQ